MQPAAYSLDWLVNAEGQCLSLRPEALPANDNPYRLYRFLTEVEDVLTAVADDVRRIGALVPRVRHLLTRSEWLQLEFSHPSADLGWSVRFLYQEPGWPLTMQIVTGLPGYKSPIHNHGTWGIVAVISGEEKHHFWRRNPTSEHPLQIEWVSSQIFSPGDIVSFLPNAIHSVEPLGDQPAVTFNLYGAAAAQRFEFDAAARTAKPF